MLSDHAIAYSDVSPKDRAALAMHFVATDNQVELRCLEHSLHPIDQLDYRGWCQRFSHLGAHHAAMHWHLRCRVERALRLHAHGHEHEDVHELECRLVSLDQALERICIEHRLGAGDLRRQPFSGLGTAGPWKPVDTTIIQARPVAPITEHVATFYDALSNFVRY